MQAITIAIGKKGITFFTQQYLLNHLQELLKQLKPPDRSIPVPDFVAGADAISKMTITLSQGHLVGYSPAFQQVVQGFDQTPVFTLSLGSSPFSAGFSWNEVYHDHYHTVIYGHPVDTYKDYNNTYGYNPSFSQLVVTVPFSFLFDKNANAWEIKVLNKTSGQTQGAQVNIPPDSVINRASADCSGNHITDATVQMIQAVDFAGPLNTVITGILATIPGSGNLGNNMVFDFSLGDSGLAFPNNDGIQMGVKGGSSYNGTPFSGDNPPSLPLPLPPADSDTHHLNMYVSNYEVDALNWAYFKAGKLNLSLTPDTIVDPEVLKVKTYVPYSSALKPYAGRNMDAQVVPNTAPVTSFQTVYSITDKVLAVLKGQLPQDVYNNVSGLDGNNYTSKADLETDLDGNGVNASYYATVEKAAESMGMVVSHDINYTLAIQDFKTNPATVFNVKRTDILSDLVLGLAADQKTQTLQFSFVNVTWTATFIRSDVPKLDGGAFQNVWGGAGEREYVALLKQMGTNGTPLPIMEGFQFDFDQAVVSMQEGYVSILADVLYKS